MTTPMRTSARERRERVASMRATPVHTSRARPLGSVSSSGARTRQAVQDPALRARTRAWEWATRAARTGASTGAEVDAPVTLTGTWAMAIHGAARDRTTRRVRTAAPARLGGVPSTLVRVPVAVRAPPTVRGAAVVGHRGAGRARTQGEASRTPVPAARRVEPVQSPGARAVAAQPARTGAVWTSASAPGRAGTRATTLAPRATRSAPTPPMTAVMTGLVEPVASRIAATSTRAAAAWADRARESERVQGAWVSSTVVPTASTRSS